MTIYKGSNKIKDSGRGVFVGSKNTNCLTYTPKHVDVELNPLNVNVTGTWGVIADGVAKGFTTANYLTLPEVFNPESNPWEVVVKFTTGTNITSEAMLLSANGNSYRHVHLYIKDSKLNVSLSSNGSSWNLGTIQSTNFLEVNKTYYAKVNFTGSDYNLYYSLDGNDYNLIGTITNSTPIYANPLTQSIGLNKHSSGAGSSWLGSIDLSQSYININGERWWSGDSYTKVGSWIDNGVVGSFTTANYVTLPEQLVTDEKSWELGLKVTTNDTVSTKQGIVGVSSDGILRVQLSSSKLEVHLSTSTSSFNIGVLTSQENLLPLTTYWIKIEYTGTTYNLYISTDGLVYNLEASKESTIVFKFPETTFIGRHRDNAWLGTIDLTQSYIKVNNEIWWQGGTGALTLKAGSKVYVPNGKNADGSLKFDEVVIENDVVNKDIGDSTTDLFTFDIERNTISGFPNTICFSGDTAPTITGWALWYDTANNLMKYKDNISSWITAATSLPFCKGAWTGSILTSIDQVFYWCGRIGNTAFVLPDVKGFIANGIKDTGTYDSTEFTVNKVLTADLDTVTDRSLLLSADKLDYVECNYNKTDNLLYNADGEVINAVECGKVTSDGTAITSLTPYTAQPLTTDIPIKFIYSGSQLVYVWQPYEPNTVILYGANTGTKTYILDAGLYQCCVVGGGLGGSWWSKGGGAAVEIQFRLTKPTTVVVYSGDTSSAGYLKIDDTRVVTANGSPGDTAGGSYSIDTTSPYYVSTIVARNGGGANLSTAGSVSPYGGWGAGGVAGGARLEYITY